MEAGKKTFVLDTNVILHDSRAIYSFKEHDICIPVEVLEELDKFKNGSDIINYNARDFIRDVEKLPEEKIFDGGASLGEGLGTIRIIMSSDYDPRVEKYFSPVTVKGHVLEKNVDHHIINTVYLLSEKTSGVVLVSKDVNMRLKAKSLKLKAENYKADAVINVDSLYKEARRINIPKEKMDQLYNQRSFEFSGKEILGPNESLILTTQGNNKQTALGIHKDGIIKLVTKESKHAVDVKPKNAEQTFALSFLMDPTISLVTIIGKAGTGKTILSIASAIEQALQKTDEGDFLYDNIFFSRQTMSLCNNDIGFLPGTATEKVNPYMQGLYDNLGVIKSSSRGYEKAQEIENNNRITIEPLSLIRGRSLEKVFFIIDEAQNLTPKEVKAIVTRAGEGTKIVFIGDISQTDTPLLDERTNGLSYLIEKMRGQDFYAHAVLIKGERSRMSEVAGNLL